MEFAVTPPRRVAAGMRLQIPLVVTFSGTSNTRDDRRVNGETVALSDFSGMWIYLSLTTADMRESLAPPRNDLFSGRKADSIHQVYCEQDSNRPTIAYATFPDVLFTRPGSYRLKVAVIDMNQYQQDNSTGEQQNNGTTEQGNQTYEWGGSTKNYSEYGY
ncbi:hypothetical protein H2200_013269 [Cladophialophora chaetospira]|uniref:Velvet domain-containing protein n=1 Tax=Cladophialophora chaetospira TaxID=386627 RepID=A0AA38TXT1_9EURO|nr:hypothetical protein H2200_013269 [Cladophialophora chaetospira]